MKKLHLTFSNSILRRIGEELNPSPSHGLLELVKNAYDADALSCSISIEQADPESGMPGKIIVEDNGDGMTLDRIRDGWLLIGKSHKESKTLTRRKRVPIGDKGLGRISAMRLGRKLTVITSPRSQPRTEYTLVIDWDTFDAASTPASTEFTVTSRRLPHARRSGTSIIIENIPTPLSGHDLNRLNRGLLLISNPFIKRNIFRTKLTISPKPAVALPSLKNLFGAAQYTLNGTYDPKAGMHAELIDPASNVIFEASHDELLPRFTRESTDESVQDLVPLSFKLWIYVLKSDEFEGGRNELVAVKQWLSEFGGIHFFQDNMRVSPYGDPMDDWVGINAIRSSSPELTPTTSSSLGFVSLSRSPKLVQKTDRSGFIDCPEFNAIRSFLRAIVKWHQAKRLELRDKAFRQEKEKNDAAAEDAEKALEKLLSNSPAQSEAAKSLLKNLTTAYKKKESLLKREIELYRTLSTAGIAASVFAHEATQNPLARISSNSKNIRFRSRKKDGNWCENEISPLVEDILYDTEGLNSIAGVTLSLVRARKRQKMKIDVVHSLSEIIAVLSEFTKKRDIDISLSAGVHACFIFGSRSSIEAAIVNLITNAIQAFDRAGTATPKISLSIAENEGAILISVSDNGPGLSGISIKDIWLPGETTREDGTGLGLTIVRAAIKDLGGRISAKSPGDLGGMDFLISLPAL